MRSCDTTSMLLFTTFLLCFYFVMLLLTVNMKEKCCSFVQLYAMVEKSEVRTLRNE